MYVSEFKAIFEDALRSLGKQLKIVGQAPPEKIAEAMMKMQKIISAMNSPSNNSGVNLLRSLKPYLKPSRQAKVDEYIQLFNMEKVFELMRQSGGDKNGS